MALHDINADDNGSLDSKSSRGVSIGFRDATRGIADLPTGDAQANVDSPRSQDPQIQNFHNDLAADRLYQKQHVATAFRFLSKQGFDEGVVSHISLRDPEHKD